MTAIILSFTIFLVYVLLPTFLILKIWKHQSPDLLNWLLWLFGSGVYIWYLYYIGVWPIATPSYYFRYTLLIAYIAASTKSFFSHNRIFSPITKKRFATLTFVGLICFFQFSHILLSFVSLFRVPEAIQLEFPLKNGKYYIAHGGNCLIMNHHFEVSAQKYAIDVLKLNNLGSRCNKLSGHLLENYNIFGDVLYSPCDGKIVDLVDGHQDLAPGMMDEGHPAGNYLVIEMGEENVSVILAHIMKGSYLVNRGDIVKKGQPLAKVGNSGNTSEPHLHIHAIKNKTGDSLFTGQGIPMQFNNRFLIRNDRV